MNDKITCPNCKGKGYNQKIITDYVACLPCHMCNMQGIIDSDKIDNIKENDREDFHGC